jgi:hypothetical protein
MRFIGSAFRLGLRGTCWLFQVYGDRHPSGWHSGPPERFVRFPFGFSPAEADIPQQSIIQTPQVTPPTMALLPEVQRSDATGQ